MPLHTSKKARAVGLAQCFDHAIVCSCLDRKTRSHPTHRLMMHAVDPSASPTAVKRREPRPMHERHVVLEGVGKLAIAMLERVRQLLSNVLTYASAEHYIDRHRHINFVWVIFPACLIVIQAAIRALAPKGFAQLARSQASKAWVRAARLAAAWRLYRQCINKLAEGS